MRGRPMAASIVTTLLLGSVNDCTVDRVRLSSCHSRRTSAASSARGSRFMGVLGPAVARLRGARMCGPGRRYGVRVFGPGRLYGVRAFGPSRLCGVRAFGLQPQALEQLAIALHVGIARREELLTVEDRIRAGEETQRLGLIAHFLA